MRKLHFVLTVALCSLFGILGCSSVNDLLPSVTLPVEVDKLEIIDTRADADTVEFVSVSIDVSGEDIWEEYSSHIKELEGLRVQANVNNQSPAAVNVALYISNTSGLSASNSRRVPY